MPAFVLHPRLAQDTIAVRTMALSDLRLMLDGRWPWAILVPRRAGASEIDDLSPADRAALIEEIAAVSRAVKQACGVERVNVGALGNMVGQLHIHVVGRNADDPAWPGPVWGFGAAQPYAANGAEDLAERLSTALDVTMDT